MSMNLVRKLWNDDCGGVISAEYMMVFAVMALGAAQGLSALRDSSNQDLREVGALATATRKQYSPNFNNGASPSTTTTQSAPQCSGGRCP
ncbi:MAG TPA: hypothetical protein VFE62_27680 [Gemmataceae bacterium]|nr:hypothetical protein [Gemmataceae bacterium]